ncbi:MAG: Autoinducer 1 sensor kinase/phosphatase LuxN [Bacteroidetes bacterium ADurb.Bin217]|nr:MAG: Autoinducer 1 sensor kinase/phosphatase LuxN [Bacteroidetes bacterium ADurb.Bin217]
MTECKVLLVDNNKIRRKLIAGYLRELQYFYAEAINGKQAIEMLTHNSFDIILMDIHLPLIDGIEATKIIRKKLPFPKNRVKIIANTSHNYKDFFNQFYDVGFNDVLPTPNTLDSLKTIIQYHTRD